VSYDPLDAEDYTPAAGLKMIMKQSIWPIVGFIFHPTYMLVNAVILGNIVVDPVKCAAANNDPYH
jgi:hypothetical protein